MKSKKSFFKRAVIKQDFRQHGWISIVYFLGLVFTVPLGLLQLASQEFIIFADYDTYLKINTEIQVFLYFSIPVAAALLLFRYIQSESSVDMIHSLPIRRETLYVSHIISGLLLLIVPIILTAIITFFVTNSIDGFAGILTISDLLTWTGLSILLTCMMFAFPVAVGFITGMTTAQAILTYVFLFLPLGMVALVSYNLSYLLFGFTPIFIEDKLMYLSPFVRFIENWGESDPYTMLELIIYIGITILSLVLGLIFYRYRQLERATEVLAFSFMKPIFKYGVTFCAMILGGSYFSASGSLNWSWIIFGYITGALIGYTAAEMILQKTWRILNLRFFTGIAIYSVVFIAILFSIKTDLFNYETKLPRMDQIEKVYFGESYHLQELTNNNVNPYSDSKLYIQDIRNLHEEIIQQRDFVEEQKDAQIQKHSAVFVYQLNNGKELKREYLIPVDALQEKLKPVLEAKDYKVNLPEFSQIQREDVINIQIVPYGPSHQYNPVTITDEKEISDFRKAIEADILSQSLEDIVGTTAPWAYIEIGYKQDNSDTPHMYEGYSVNWKKSFTSTTKWLEDHGYLENTRIDETDITNAEVTYVPTNPQEDIYMPEVIYERGQKHVTITEKETLSTIIYHFSEYSEENVYYVKLTLTDGNVWYGSIPTEYVPEDAKNQIQ
ncbi:ABC transporter permease subunit [Metabacillus schmidteae]|uniref:ABC transporter permease subunit n=1 Tax=Metabacillus schmidteae TaxID=2730405 RepID=UPI00158B7D3A|nr:ABC transporter permease subunit [Metabacillus schmidteae]